MYVCICRAVTDGHIKEAISQGACTRNELAHCLGVGMACGKCTAQVRALLQTHAPFRSSCETGPGAAAHFIGRQPHDEIRAVAHG